MYAQSLSRVRLFATPRTVACQTPESPVHGILQARVLEWIAISSSRGSSRAGDRTCVSCGSCIGGRILHHCATRNKWQEMILKVPSHLGSRMSDNGTGWVGSQETRGSNLSFTFLGPWVLWVEQHPPCEDMLVS